MLGSVEVHNYLQGLDIPHEMFRLSRSTANLAQAAAEAGLELDQMAQVKLFRADDKVIMVIIPADSEVDFGKLKRVAEVDGVDEVPREEISSITGYLDSATPPVGLKSEVEVYIDYYALREEVIYTGSGDPDLILKIRSYDLVRATEGEVADVTLDR
ncbi:MAG: YbaK/EbsC family protein [Actinomycetota bacterium]|nr:YbaK/EbsC family protein [Actinomycetota bacterium]